MDKFEVIALSAVFAVLAIRLYQKYFKKDLTKGENSQQKQGGNLFSSNHHDDDYEPYSKK
jgi:hypothetical protein